MDVTGTEKPSNPIYIKGFIKKTQALQNEEKHRIPTHSRNASEILDDLGLDQLTAANLKHICNPEMLTTPMERSVMEPSYCENLPSTIDLCTVQQRKERICMLTRHVKVKKSTLARCRMIELDASLRKKWAGAEVKDESDQVAVGRDAVVVVRVSLLRSARKFKNYYFDYVCLASQPLTALRDIISCPQDFQQVTYGGEKENVLKNHITSSTFFIKDTFYTDDRKKTDIDLAKYTIEWIKAQPADQVSHLPPANEIKQRLMREVKFEDLTVELGKPYVYMHMGDCEHEIKFIDIRLLGCNDCQSISAYPHAICRPRCKAQMCKGCQDNVGTLITTNDELSDEDPSFWCKSCFEDLHFDKKGHATGSFCVRNYVNVCGLK